MPPAPDQPDRTAPADPVGSFRLRARVADPGRSGVPVAVASPPRSEEATTGPEPTGAGQRRLVRLRLAALVGTTAVAFHHSLEDLVGTLAYDTPLAYLGLVPLLALGLGVLLASRPGDRPRTARRLPDRDVDWIVGLPLLAASAWIALVLPDRLDYSFWTSRIDVLALPPFVAGLVALLFGVAVLRRVLPAVAMLALAWPVPWEAGVDELLLLAQRLTLEVTTLVAPLVGANRTDGSLFEIGSGARAFVVNVAPQCAGANSIVGWLLIGVATCLALPAGRRRAKASWLAAGVAVLFATNVARIAALFALGAGFGESVAIDWVHPYIGLLLFVLVVSAMAAALPRFGLPALGDLLAPGDGVRPGDPALLRRRPLSAPVLGVLALVLVVLPPANADLARFDPFRDVDSAAARPFAAVADGIEGFRGSAFDTVAWGQQYFGAGSTWTRHRYLGATSATPIYLDLISTRDLRTFSEFGVEACYSFHEYAIADVGRVDVGAAAPAQHLTFFNLDTGSWWTAVSTVQATDDRDGRRYERILALAPLGGTDPDVEPLPARVGEARSLLVDFSEAVVAATAP